jgi:hypothetical protein
MSTRNSSAFTLKWNPIPSTAPAQRGRSLNSTAPSTGARVNRSGPNTITAEAVSKVRKKASRAPGHPVARNAGHHGRADRHIQRPGDAQKHPGLRAPQCVEIRKQWRLIEPEIGIEGSAGEDVDGGRGGIGFLHPENSRVEQPENENGGKHQKELPPRHSLRAILFAKLDGTSLS